VLKIHAIPAFNDNYIWLIQAANSKQVLIVDPGDAEPVVSAIEQYQLKPTAILITHHHSDHIGGVSQLIADYNIPVYGPNTSLIAGITHPLDRNKHSVVIEGFPEIAVLDVAGHTADHIAFLIENNLFCGDTLFAAGCGRLLGGTAEQLFNSLTLIAALAPETAIYCAHEYTLANLAFAATVEPDNIDIQQRTLATKTLRKQGQASVPSRLSLELQTNPFLRCDDMTIKKAAEKWSSQQLDSPQEVFTALRKWKDGF